MNIGNNKNMGFNKSNIDNSIIKKIDEKIKEVTDVIIDMDKVEVSEVEPTDEDVFIWINPAEDSPSDIMLRINDEAIADHTVWSSSKINQEIQDTLIESSSHVHQNKEAIDLITEKDITRWNNKSEFNGSYNDLVDKPFIPSINGLATEEYVDNIVDTAIDNIDLSIYATKEEIPTKMSALENDEGYLKEIPSEYITEEELGKKGYISDTSDFVLQEDLPKKVSQLENDLFYVTETIMNNTISETVEDLNTTISSDTEPSDENVVLWINTSQDENTESIARINDDTVASNTTWSSNRIDEVIRSLSLVKEGNIVKLMLGNIELSNISIE